MRNSSTFSVHSIAGALMAADEKLGKKQDWVPDNDEQSRFLEEYFPQIYQDIINGIPEITYTAEIIGDSKDKGSVPALDLTVTGRFDALVKWLKSGNPEAIIWTRQLDKFQFPAVKMNSSGVRIVDSEGLGKTSAILLTESDDYSLMLTEAHSAALSGMSLVHFMTTLHTDTVANNQFSGVRFPMVDIRHSPDISWFKGMTSYCGPVKLMPLEGTIIKVTEATQDNLLRMDEVGARVVSYTRMRMEVYGSSRVEVPPQPFVIENPFYLGVFRKDVKIPIFVAYVTEKDWKKPDSLEEVDI